MNPAEQDHLTATRDALSRAREADERLRSALAEATVWLTIAMTDDAGIRDEDSRDGAEGTGIE